MFDFSSLKPFDVHELAKNFSYKPLNSSSFYASNLALWNEIAWMAHVDAQRMQQMTLVLMFIYRSENFGK